MKHFGQVLQSGWPIFGLLGLVAYKLSRDGAGKDAICDQPTESFRIRYEDGVVLNKACLNYISIKLIDE